MVLMKWGTVVLAFLFLGVAIIAFTLEVSVLIVLAGENSASPVGCYKLTPSTGWQRVDCIDPYRPFVILPPLLTATTAVAVAANRTANRRLALRFSGIVLVAVGMLFLTLGITGLQSDAIPAHSTDAPQYFHPTMPRTGMRFTPDWQ